LSGSASNGALVAAQLSGGLLSWRWRAISTSRHRQPGEIDSQLSMPIMSWHAIIDGLPAQTPGAYLTLALRRGDGSIAAASRSGNRSAISVTFRSISEAGPA